MLSNAAKKSAKKKATDNCTLMAGLLRTAVWKEEQRHCEEVYDDEVETTEKQKRRY